MRACPHPPMPFVVGLSRSGTTLLRLMLDAPSLMAIPSGTFFIPEARRVCAGSPQPAASFLPLLGTHWKWPDFHLDAAELRQEVQALDPFDLGDALRAFYRLYARRFGKPRYGDKSAYLWEMEEVQEALPEAVFIHLIRDGRDVALSIRPFHWGPNMIAEAADWWSAGIRRARRQAAGLRRYLEVRYEELIADPAEVLRRVCAAVELPFNPAIHAGSSCRRSPRGPVAGGGRCRGRSSGSSRSGPASSSGSWDMHSAEGDERRTAGGCNAVEFSELTFVPTREAPHHDHPDYRRTMRWYYPFAPRDLHLARAWKRQVQPVDLASMFWSDS